MNSTIKSNFTVIGSFQASTLYKYVVFTVLSFSIWKTVVVRVWCWYGCISVACFSRCVRMFI